MTCDSYLQGIRLRATRLNDCGEVEAGECGYVVTKGFISVALSVNETDPTEIAQVLADGTRCYFKQTPKILNNISASIEMCEVDPELFELLTGSPLVLDDEGEPIGFTTDSETYALNNAAIELWTNLARNNCGVVNGRRWGYYLLPWVTGGTVSKPTIENGAINFTIADAFTVDGNQWGIGPYDMQLDLNGDPSPLFEALASTAHDLLYKTNLEPPDPLCGCQTLVPVT
jgi:hypothetical protein